MIEERAVLFPNVIYIVLGVIAGALLTIAMELSDIARILERAR